MDLDDSFTEGLLRSLKKRREFINEQRDVLPPAQKRAAPDESAEDQSELPPEESPKRMCTGMLRTPYSSHNKENIEIDETTSDFVPYHLASKTRGLAALKKRYTNDDDDDCYSKASGQEVNKCNKFIFSNNSSDLCGQQKQKPRFADLAANIRQWEDITHTPTLSSKNVTSSTNTTNFQMPQINTPNSTNETFSMKVYYTNKQSSDTINTPKNGVSNYPDYVHSSSSHSKGALDTTPACKKGNIEVGSVRGKWGKLQAWDRAVMATLETQTVNSPKENSLQISNKKPQENVKLVPNFYPENPDEIKESINEDDFSEDYDDIKADLGFNNMELNISPSEDIKEEVKSNKLEKLETPNKPTAPVSQENAEGTVDPAELPLSARKALFENAFINGTPKVNDDVSYHKLSVTQRAKMFENATKTTSEVKTANFKEPKRMTFSNFEKFEKRNTAIQKSPFKSLQSAVTNNLPELKASPVKRALQTASPVKKVIPNSASPQPSPTKNVGNHTRLIQQKLMASTGSNWQEKQTAKAAEERKQEISSLVNHWEKLSSCVDNYISHADNNSESEKASVVSETGKPYKAETVYESGEESDLNHSEHEECLNEDESKDEESLNEDQSKDEEDLNEDESKNIVRKENILSDIEEDDDADSRAENTENEDFYYEETKTGSLTSIEGNTEQQFSDTSNYTCDNNTRSFTSCSSNVSSIVSDSNYHASTSQSCSSGSSVRSFDFNVPTTTSKSKEVFLEKPEKKETKNPEISLLRTVSAYRREKQETKLTPVRTVVRREKVNSPESCQDDDDFTEVIQQRLKELQDEVLKQQIAISQASQVINLCSATAEFSGSIEQVEGEKLLLIATQKRQACLNEIQRLKTCGAQGENLIDGTGSLTISDLELPLKREFITAQLEGRGTDTVHYFLCLIRHGAQVIVTQMMSTDERGSNGTLSFTNLIQLHNLPADFSIVFEVYALQTKKEVLPHEKKYHIKRENSKKRLTPKGKKSEGKFPAVCSPGGPNAVRSPSFGVVGFTRFNLQNCNKKTFTLDKVPFSSPLEGVLRVHIQLHAEHKVMLKGFLTFYEDVGRIGALYRRWCVLDGSNISYWLYPEDENTKEPLGSIDLRQCVTGTVKSVPTLECARPHTFKLVTVRPQKKGDKNTLVSRTVNTLTTTKYLLTADTKDERILWCNKINEALENVRKWDPQALRPVESMNI